MSFYFNQFSLTSFDIKHRYNKLKRYIKNISHKSLSSDLKALEKDGLINRKSYDVIPPKVEYSLTDKGESLMKVLDELCKWGEENKNKH